MIYLLFHKNVPVLSFDYDVENSSILDIKNVANEEHIPIGIYNSVKKNFTANLNFWWKSRFVPESRKKTISKVEFAKLVSQSYGFNLTDQYWIKPENSSMTWKEGNFFLNSFSEDIGKFIIKESRNFNERMSSNSPDIFSNGEQDKRWVIQNGTRYLLKYGKAPYFQEPINEVFASEICRRLGFSHVPYTSIKKGTKSPKYYSSCACFVSENTEYVPAGFVMKLMKKNNSDSLYTHLIKCCEKLKMPNLGKIEKQIAQMVFLDYVTANTDRHFGNFGFMRNADSLEWYGLAPNFDSGNSMFFNQPTSVLRNENYFTRNVGCLSFARTQDKQLKKFADKILKLDIDFSKLDNLGSYFTEILSTNIYIDDERAESLGTIANNRAKSAMRLVYTKNSVTKLFLNTIKENLHNQDFFAAVKKAKNDIEYESKENKTVINKYLEILTPKNETELKSKIEKDIANLGTVKKKPEPPSPAGGLGI